MLGQEDATWEQSLSSNPYELRTWCSYLKFKADAPHTKRCLIYERALSHLSRSYTLWAAYLEERTLHLARKCITDKRYSTLIETYERALKHMNKMPRIWINYCKLLVKLKKGTATRIAFDRALKALPVTQHKELWEVYIDWALGFGVFETSKQVLRRYIMFEPTYRETYIDLCLEQDDFAEAATHLKSCVDEASFVSSTGRSRKDLFMQLCDVLTEHPDAVDHIDVKALIRGGMETYKEHVGKLWCQLANYHVRLGQFDEARAIFEEGIASVATVRDFSIVFDALVKVEESTLLALMQSGVSHDSPEVEERMSRIEAVLERRPELVNSVLLRQHPHNVREWLKRVNLVSQAGGEGRGEAQHESKGKGQAGRDRILQTYEDALAAVDPSQAVGRVSSLWAGLAHYHEKLEEEGKARLTWKRASKAALSSAEERAIIVCGWAEMEMRLHRYAEARELARKALYEEEEMDSPLSVRDSVKVWALYLDLEESLGSHASCRAAYDEAMKRKAITADMCLNYAAYLEEANFFEDSFKVYERSLALFPFPQVKVIWIRYIEKFLARYGGGKMERLRDLFEQSLQNAPEVDATDLYLKYAQAEEEHGAPRRAVAVYDRATQAVPSSRRLDMYRLYVKKIAQHLDTASTRPAYERGIKELEDEDACALCGDYAACEARMGELERARAIFVHGSQFANPSRNAAYWTAWRDFEENHGNENTFRDMLRTQRSVEASFSHVNYTAIDMVAAASEKARGAEGDSEQLGEIVGIKRKFVAAGDNEVEAATAKKGRSEEAGDDQDGEGEVVERTVPKQVYGEMAMR